MIFVNTAFSIWDVLPGFLCIWVSLLRLHRIWVFVKLGSSFETVHLWVFFLNRGFSLLRLHTCRVSSNEIIHSPNTHLVSWCSPVLEIDGIMQRLFVCCYSHNHVIEIHVQHLNNYEKREILLRYIPPIIIL
jgi:hypothetical protein